MIICRNWDTSQLFAVAIGHSGDTSFIDSKTNKIIDINRCSYFYGNWIISGNTAATTARVKPDGTNLFTTGFPGSAIIRSFALRYWICNNYSFEFNIFTLSVILYII